MKKKTIISIAAVTVVAAVAFFYLRKPKDEEKIDEVKEDILAENTDKIPELATPGIKPAKPEMSIAIPDSQDVIDGKMIF